MRLLIAMSGTIEDLKVRISMAELLQPNTPMNEGSTSGGVAGDWRSTGDVLT